MSYHLRHDRIEHRTDTIMRHNEYWVLTAIGMICLIAAFVVWMLA